MFTVDAVPACKDNYIWMLINQKTSGCIVVDPGEAPQVITYLKNHQLSLKAIFVTHHHWDHSNGVAELLEHEKAPVYGPSKENIASVDHKLEDKQFIHLDEIQAKFIAMELPGHTAGQIAYYGHSMVFTGDTLFSAGCGRMFEGTPEIFSDSLMQLKNLPEETKIYCGHEYTINNLKFALTVEPNNQAAKDHLEHCKQLISKEKKTLPSTIGLERKINPFLRITEQTVIQAAEGWADRQLSSPADVFKILRKWKDSF